jgi:hypothetical protein
MTTESQHKRLKRQKALRRTIDRLDRKINGMLVNNKRLSQGRLAAFLTGIGLLFLPETKLKWILVIVVGGLFLYLVLKHHRLYNRMKRYRIWRKIKQTNFARMKLRWSEIPEATITNAHSYGALGKELDLVGPKSLHHLMDLSISELGSRRLASWLTQTEPDIHRTQKRRRVIRELASASHFRERLLLNFHLTTGEKINSEKMTRWLHVPFSENSITVSLRLSIALILLTLLLILADNMVNFPDVWKISYALYILLFFSRAHRLTPVLKSAQDLDDELSVFKRVLLFLEKYQLHNYPHLSGVLTIIQDPERRPSGKIRSLKIATACIGLRNNPIMTLLLNLFFPWDFLFARWTLRLRKQLYKEFPLWLSTLARLEAMNSLANFSYINPHYCFPKLLEDDTEGVFVLDTRALGHPLIDPENKVTNHYSLGKIGDITLITGSNMAGKSTFLKTVGINLILAYAGGPVNADVFAARFFRIHTCIDVGDSLSDGVSSFYAEVKRLRKILDQIGQPNPIPVLFFIDEILRGTNNRERLIGSAALIRSLSQTRSAGLITTHDLELTSLQAEYDGIFNYHFSETLRDGKMLFLYKLQDGPCPTTNALEIMRIEGLPINYSKLL